MISQRLNDNANNKGDLMAKNSDDEFDFALWLQELGHGATNKQATEQLRKLITACAETGSKGSLTLTIKAGTAGGMAELKASIKSTIPQPPLPGGTYYVTPSGALATEDPRQLALPKKILDIQPVRTPPRGDAS